MPVNQRSYAWKRSHVEDLFSDLNGAITKKAEEYFLGSIVVVVPDKADYIEVYDGQQRIATTMILIAAIRDFFFSTLKDEKEAGVITSDSLISLQRKGKEIPHFGLSSADRDFFVAKILRDPDHPDRQKAVPDPKKESHELLVEAAEAAAEHVLPQKPGSDWKLPQEHSADDVTGTGNEALVVVSRAEFVERIFWEAVQAGALIVGFKR